MSFMQKLSSLITGIALCLPVLCSAAGTDTLQTSALSVANSAFSSAAAAVDSPNIDDRTARTVSNVLKTRHDTVKNSIGNIR